MKPAVLKALLVLLAGYLLVLGLRWLFLETGGVASNRPWEATEMIGYSGGLAMGRGGADFKNIAREEIAVSQSEQGSAAQSMEMEYQKVANVSATTSAFDADEAGAKAAVAAVRGVIQGEDSSGIDHHRSVALTIGVPPKDFDPVVAALGRIGRTRSLHITKTDKTGEFQELRARRVTLEKSQAALLALKEQGARIEESIALEHEILDVTGKLEELDVQLGQYSKDRNLCTIQFELEESAPEVVTSRHFARFMAAMEWAGPVYLEIVGACCAGLLCLALAVGVFSRALPLMFAGGADRGGGPSPSGQ